MWKINIDEIDLMILYLFSTLNGSVSLTTTEVAKMIFRISGRDDLQKKDTLVRRHLKKLSSYSLLKVINNGAVTKYKINEEKVCFKGDIYAVDLIIDNVLVRIRFPEYLMEHAEEENIEVEEC